MASSLERLTTLEPNTRLDKTRFNITNEILNMASFITKFLIIVIICLPFLSAHSIVNPDILIISGDGSSVGNGGGDRESLISITYQQVVHDIKRCQFLGLCQKIPTQLFSCQLPSIDELSFQNISRGPIQSNELPYLRKKMQGLKLIINREYLYNKSIYPSFNSVDATRLLTRIFLETCNLISFKKSKNILKGILDFYNAAWESITVGTDDLELDEKDLIYIRSYHQYLILESIKETVVLTCTNLAELKCIRVESANGVSATERVFQYLSLSSEEIIQKRLVFHLQAYYQSSLFNLEAQVHEGYFKEIKINDNLL